MILFTRPSEKKEIPNHVPKQLQMKEKNSTKFILACDCVTMSGSVGVMEAMVNEKFLNNRAWNRVSVYVAISHAVK